MSLYKHGMLGAVTVFMLLSILLCCACFCSPVSYRDDIIEVTTTPKTVEDRFPIKHEHKTKNDSFMDDKDIENQRYLFRERQREFDDNYSESKVKAVLPGEKTLRQSNDDDDDDDDGGEYEGFDYSNDVRTENKKSQQCKPDKAAAAAAGVPMMIIREVDMVALQIPLKEPEEQKKEQKEWSEWSPCSRPCRGGQGLQRRWRQPGTGVQREQQLRPCHLADCQQRPSFF